MPDDPTISPAVESLAKRKLLPTSWTSAQLRQLSAATKRQSFFSATNLYDGLLDEMKQAIESITGGEPDMDAGTMRLRVRALGSKLGYDPEDKRGTIQDLTSDPRINLVLRTNRDVAQGLAQHIADNDPDVVAAFPAWEMIRVADRTHPRGEKDPEDGWDARWEAACQEVGDLEALSVFETTGRKVALKSSEVWGALGQGAGGYEDTLDNDGVPPWAYNSGMGRENISFDECVELGLLDEDSEVEPSPLNLADLFNTFEGHAGRPGERGGSLPKTAQDAPDTQAGTSVGSGNKNAPEGQPGGKVGQPSNLPKEKFHPETVMDEEGYGHHIVHLSTRPDAELFQVTRFDGDGNPLGHDTAPTLAKALDDAGYFRSERKESARLTGPAAKAGGMIKARGEELKPFGYVSELRPIGSWAGFAHGAQYVNIPGGSSQMGVVFLDKPVSLADQEHLSLTPIGKSWADYRQQRAEKEFGAWAKVGGKVGAVIANSFDESQHPRDTHGKFAVVGSNISSIATPGNIVGMMRARHVSEADTPEGQAERKLKPRQVEAVVTRGENKGKVNRFVTLGDSKKFKGVLSEPFYSPATGKNLLHVQDPESGRKLVYDRDSHVAFTKDSDEKSWRERHYGHFETDKGEALPAHLDAKQGGKSIPGDWLAHKPVWISKDPKADICARGFGRDGEPVAVYSAHHEAMRDAGKADTCQRLMGEWGKIEKQNQSNQKSTDPVKRECADATRLIMQTGIRSGIGGGDNFGCTTLEKRHLVTKFDQAGKAHMFLDFIGKKEGHVVAEITDPVTQNMLMDHEDKSPDEKLFHIPGNSLSAYSHALGRGGYKTKDFRMGFATRLADEKIKEADYDVDKKPKTEKELNDAMAHVANQVARSLGHSDVGGTALKAYIQPFVWNKVLPDGVTEIPKKVNFRGYPKRKVWYRGLRDAP